MTAPVSQYVAAGRAWVAVLVQYAPGAVIPRHRHLGDEQIYVLEGSVSDDTGTCTAGDYARRPPGCVHTVHSASARWCSPS